MSNHQDNNVAMVPVRMGSKRVKSKNIRMIAGYPLVYYILKSVIESNKFKMTNIYINSEDNIFKSLAEKLGINFYLRPSYLATDSATNDDFVLDFIKNVNCSNIFQFLSTSPLIKAQTISNFFDSHINSNMDTSISVSEVRIECLYKNKGINFLPTKQTPPSQELEPILAYACGLMAWSKEKFISNYHKFNGAAYHGGEDAKNLFKLSEIESIDIDNEEDFLIAESLLSRDFCRTNEVNSSRLDPIYWEPSMNIDFPSLIHKTDMIN